MDINLTATNKVRDRITKHDEKHAQLEEKRQAIAGKVKSLTEDIAHLRGQVANASIAELVNTEWLDVIDEQVAEKSTQLNREKTLLSRFNSLIDESIIERGNLQTLEKVELEKAYLELAATKIEALNQANEAFVSQLNDLNALLKRSQKDGLVLTRHGTIAMRLPKHVITLTDYNGKTYIQVRDN